MDQPPPPKHPCPDCRMCQHCAESRCRLCRGQVDRGPHLSLAEQIALYEQINACPDPKE